MTTSEEQRCRIAIGLSKEFECEPFEVIDACMDAGILSEEEAGEINLLLIQYQRDL